MPHSTFKLNSITLTEKNCLLANSCYTFGQFAASRHQACIFTCKQLQLVNFWQTILGNLWRMFIAANILCKLDQVFGYCVLTLNCIYINQITHRYNFK